MATYNLHSWNLQENNGKSTRSSKRKMSGRVGSGLVGSNKLLLALTRRVIFGFEPWRDPRTRFYSLLDMYVCRTEDSSTVEERGFGSVFHIGATFVTPQFQHEYIRAVMASMSLWTLYIQSLHYTEQHVYRVYRESRRSR
jgi:hypothetical protein